jgi:hypothetical protein
MEDQHEVGDLKRTAVEQCAILFTETGLTASNLPLTSISMRLESYAFRRISYSHHFLGVSTVTVLNHKACKY